MVMPSIFRTGTCFMGFSARNSLENCGEKVLVGWVAWPDLAKAEAGKQEAPRPAAHPHTSLPGKGPALRPEVMPGRSVQYPSLWCLLGYRLHPYGLCAPHTGPEWGKDPLATHSPGVRH